jgi:hypothetical protein
MVYLPSSAQQNSRGNKGYSKLSFSMVYHGALTNWSTIMKKTVYTLALTLFASMPSFANIIVDMEGVDEKDYVYDLHKCEEMAGQVQKQQASGGAISGAAKGAALGSAGVAIAGGSGTEGAKKGAAVGLAAGVLGRGRANRENTEQYKQDQQSVIKNCMANRGYVVLN